MSLYYMGNKGCVQGVSGALTIPRPVGTQNSMSGNSQPEREANSTSSSVEIMKFLSNITTSPSVSSSASNILLNTFFTTTFSAVLSNFLRSIVIFPLSPRPNDKVSSLMKPNLVATTFLFTHSEKTAGNPQGSCC